MAALDNLDEVQRSNEEAAPSPSPTKPPPKLLGGRSVARIAPEDGYREDSNGSRPSSPPLDRSLSRGTSRYYNHAGAPFASRTSSRKSMIRDANMNRFMQRHGKSVASDIRASRARMAEKIKEVRKGKVWVIKPENNKFLGRWDMLTSFALMWTATVTPFETAFLPVVLGPESWKDPWFLSNRVLDVIFTIDMILQFFVAYQKNDGFGGLQWVDRHVLVVKHYLKSWFVLDLVTIVVPLTVDLILAAPKPTSVTKTGPDDDRRLSEEATTISSFTMLRVLRAMRFIKLLRLVRASRLFERWKAVVTLNYATQTFLNIFLIFVFVTHWFACIISLQASMHFDPSDTWMGAYGLCGSNKDGGCQDMTTFSWYLAAFSWSTMVLTGTGGTDFYPSGKSDGETAVVLCLVILGAFLWTFVLASFCDVATNSNPAAIAFRQQLDGLNDFVRLNALPYEMAKRLRTYMHQQKGIMLKDEAGAALPRLSTALQIEVVLSINSVWMDTVWFIRDLDAPVKVRIAMAMRPKVLAPGEVAPNRHFYVMMRGQAMYGRRVLSRGMSWGDDVILSYPPYFLPYLARAMTYADVTVISRAEIYEQVSIFPSSVKRLRRSTIYLALRRCMVTTAKEVMKIPAEYRESSVYAYIGTADEGGSEGRRKSSSLLDTTFQDDFIDKMHKQLKEGFATTEAQKQSNDIALELDRLETKRAMGDSSIFGALTTGVTTGSGGGDGGDDWKESVEELKKSMKRMQSDIKKILNEQRELAQAVSVRAREGVEHRLRTASPPP